MTQTQDSDLPTIERDPRRIRVLFSNHEVADSTDVLVVREPGRAPVRYFPRKDVAMVVLGQTQHHTVSPTKGPATYWTIYRDGHIAENAAWSFEAPPPPFHALAGRMAFQAPHFEFAAEGHTSADWDADAADNAAL